MKLSLFMLVLVAYCWATDASYAQSTKISITAGNKTLKELFTEIEEKSEFIFFYNDNAIDLSREVNINTQTATIDRILDQVLKGMHTKYKIVDRQVIFYKAKSTVDVEDAGVFQQTGKKQIKGRVVDATGEPVIGANVLEKGTTNGNITDIDGVFTLNVGEGAILQVSYIGYINQEIAVGNQTNLRITLSEDNQALEEVVVVGYGTMKKREILGSISTLKSEDIMKTMPTSIDAALQGMTSGVSVTSSGVPGAPVQVKIRGISSITMSTDPLWIIDGIPVTTGTIDQSYNGEIRQNILSMIDPSDIESIQILKDAAATSIYGSRGSNGVILVTTKSGKKGETTFDVDIRTGVSEWTKSDIGLASGAEYVSIMDLARKNSRMNGEYEPIQSLGQLDNVDKTMTRAEALATNTNWADQVSRMGDYMRARLSISSGTEKSSSYLSLNYRKDNSNFKFSDLQTLSANANLSYKALDKLTFEFKTMMSYTDNNRVKSGDGKQGSGGWAQVNSNALPWMKVYDPEGLNGYWNSQAYTNALAGMDPVNSYSNLKTLNLISALSATLDLPVKGLSLKGELGLNYINSMGVSWISEAVRELGAIAKENKDQVSTFNYNTYFNYDITIAHDHSLNAVAGLEGTRGSGSYTSLIGEGLVGTYQQIGTPEHLSGSSKFGGETYLMGLFGRLNYNFNKKYYAGFSMRRDGISQFIPEYRWSNFLSGSLGWIISEEDFFRPDAINLLKLRGSYGQTGNANVPTGLDVDSWSINSGSGTLMGFNNSTLENLGNPYLHWETTSTLDVGFDFGLLENRVSGSVAYYKQSVEDMLLKISLPESAGIRGGNGIWQNIGDMINYGVEFNFDANLIRNKDFYWSVGGNFSTNGNKVLALDPVIDKEGVGLEQQSDSDGNYRTLTKKGLPIGTWYMAEFAGVDSEKGIPLIYEVERLEDGSTVHTGKIIPGTEVNINNNKMILNGKTSIPKILGGFHTNVSYKMFDLNMAWSFSAGHYIYNRLKQSTMTLNTGLLTLSKDLLTDTWQKPGDQSRWPQTTYSVSYFYDDDGNPTDVAVKYGSDNQTPNSMWLEKGDFLRLRSLQLGFNFPEKINRSLMMKSVRIYLSGNNLLTFAKFSGYDPEVEIGRNSSSSVVIFNNLPQSRIYSIGINAKF